MTTIAEREADLLNEFLAGARLFLGPDPEIMGEHDIAPRTAREDQAMTAVSDPHECSLVRARLLACANEAFEMGKQTGASPGARWGDMICGIFTASGDLAMCSSPGVLLFAVLTQHAVKYIVKHWVDDPTVGVRPGDAFTHNDARFGNIHNTDQSLILPLFRVGELVGWVGVTNHVGENGATEPGGMPATAESPYDEGLKMSPFKVAENYRLKRDLVTFLQNSVRDPKLQFEDMKSKLYACMRMEDRISGAIEEFGIDAVISVLRRTLEETKEEVRRRLREWPDGTVRAVQFGDGTLRENLLMKINLELTKRGDELIFDFRGSSPQFMNRSINCVQASLKGLLAQAFFGYIWPDLPRNQAVLAPIKVVVDERSVLNSSPDVPTAQCMQSFFFAFSATQLAVQKFQYAATRRYTRIHAPFYNEIQCFCYGGITQHDEFVGNICGDINGMAGGAREGADGEHALSLTFCAMADQGEQELSEEENPFLEILSRNLMRDNQGFGKWRGGHGFQMGLATRGTPMFGFMTCCVGSKFPTINGLFGGYGCPTYPLAKVKNVDIFAVLRERPETFRWTIEEIMNEQPFEGAQYSTHHMGMPFEAARDGELYMCTQGTGAGYGDVLERDPAAVVKDLRENLISDGTARTIYRVVYDPETMVVDETATQRARDEERQARLSRGVPYTEYVKTKVSDAPPEELPYFGCWSDRGTLFAGNIGGLPRMTMPADQITPIYLPDPRDARIAELEATVQALRSPEDA